jgi:ribosomal protein L24
MPKLDEDVRVVKGEHRGTTGRLMERNKKEDKVKLMLNNTSFDIVEISQNDC